MKTIRKKLYPCTVQKKLFWQIKQTQYKKTVFIGCKKYLNILYFDILNMKMSVLREK